MTHGYDSLYAKAEKIALADYKGKFITADEYEASEMVSTADWESVEDPPTAPDGVRYLWGCAPTTATVWEDILDTILEDHHEDAQDQVDTLKFRQALAMMNDALSKVVTHYPDTSVAVILPR